MLTVSSKLTKKQKKKPALSQGDTTSRWATFLRLTGLIRRLELTVMAYTFHEFLCSWDRFLERQKKRKEKKEGMCNNLKYGRRATGMRADHYLTKRRNIPAAIRVCPGHFRTGARLLETWPSK